MCPELIRGSGGDAGLVFLIPGGCGKRCFFVSSFARFSLAVPQFFVARGKKDASLAGGGDGCVAAEYTRPPSLLAARPPVRSQAPNT